MVPVICGGCGQRGTVALAKLAAATNPQCPRCGSRDLDLDERTTKTAEVGDRCGCENSECQERHTPGRCQNIGTVPCRFIGQLCDECATYMPAVYLDMTPYVEPTASRIAFTDPPMDTLSDTDRVIEQVTCSNCLQSFNHAAGDPADPLPPCPNCGSMATSVAGGGATHASSLDAKAAELVDAIRATNPGMTRGAAQRLAYRTIERFPRVAGLTNTSSNATVPMDPAEVERRRHAPAPDDMEDMPHAIDRLLHNRWHTPA